MGRETELAIVITMYNEDEELFCRTLYGVMKNIAHLQGRKNSSTWGPGSWKKVSGKTGRRQGGNELNCQLFCRSWYA